MDIQGAKIIKTESLMSNKDEAEAKDFSMGMKNVHEVEYWWADVFIDLTEVEAIETQEYEEYILPVLILKSGQVFTVNESIADIVEVWTIAKHGESKIITINKEDETETK